MSDVSCFWQLSSPLKPLLLLTCSEPKWAAWSAPISQGMAMANLSSTEQHSLWKIVGMHKCACAHVYIQETEIFDFGFCFCGGGGGSTSGSASGSTSGSEVRLRVRVLLWLTKHCLRICWFCIFFVGGGGGEEVRLRVRLELVMIWTHRFHICRKMTKPCGPLSLTSWSIAHEQVMQPAGTILSATNHIYLGQELKSSSSNKI